MVQKVRLEERTSKQGNSYKVLVITFTNGYEKTVFLDRSEIYMLETLNNAK